MEPVNRQVHAPSGAKHALQETAGYYVGLYVSAPGRCLSLDERGWIAEINPTGVGVFPSGSAADDCY